MTRLNRRGRRRRLLAEIEIIAGLSGRVEAGQRKAQVPEIEVGPVGISNETAVSQAVEERDLGVDITLVRQRALKSLVKKRRLEKEGNVETKNLGRRAGRERENLAGPDDGIVAGGGNVGVPFDDSEERRGVAVLVQHLQEARGADDGGGHGLGLDVEFLAVLGLGEKDGAGLEINFVGGGRIIEDRVRAKAGNGLVAELKFGARGRASLEILAVVNLCAGRRRGSGGRLGGTVTHIIHRLRDRGDLLGRERMARHNEGCRQQAGKRPQFHKRNEWVLPSAVKAIEISFREIINRINNFPDSKNYRTTM